MGEAANIGSKRSAHRQKLLSVFTLTFGYLVVEVIGGLLTHSLALRGYAEIRVYALQSINTLMHSTGLCTVGVVVRS